MVTKDELAELAYVKIDQIREDQQEIKITLAKQEESLRHHVYRTDLAEANIELLRKEIAPLSAKAKFIEGSLKLVGALGVVITILSAIASIIYHLSHLKN